MNRKTLRICIRSIPEKQLEFLFSECGLVVVSIRAAPFKQLYGTLQRIVGHMDITIHDKMRNPSLFFCGTAEKQGGFFYECLLGNIPPEDYSPVSLSGFITEAPLKYRRQPPPWQGATGAPALRPEPHSPQAPAQPEQTAPWQ